MGAGIHTTPRHLTKKFSGSIGNTTSHSLPGRGDRARHRVGAGGLGAVVAKWHARGATLGRELNFREYSLP
jgi:hypothetical protein